MPQPLNLGDLRSIRELQPQGMNLDLERARLWPHTALNAALAARLPFSEIGASTFVLYQSQGKRRPLGLIQTRLRRSRPEADVTFIAPALDARPDAVTIWYRLLAEAANNLGEQGCQRIYVQVPAENGAEEVFRQAGFTAYTHEEIYYLPAERLKALKTALPGRLRRQRKRDSWELLKMYTAATPRPVQMAEGVMGSDGQVGKLGDWWDQAQGTGYVLASATDGSLVGAARVVRGRAANWLRFYFKTTSPQEADELVDQVLDLLRAARHRPTYCPVRDYEGGLRGALLAAGFDPFLQRSLMVKHTTARIKEPATWAVPALEKRAPVIHTRINARELDVEQELQTV